MVIDARTDPPGALASPEVVSAICARGTGVGADGVVFLENSAQADFGMTYLNRDGSRAALCGNASLCIANLAAELGMVPADGFRFATDAGVIHARVTDGQPEVDLEPPQLLNPAIAIRKEPGEQRIGFVVIGVPHLVVLVDSIAPVDVRRRGAALRWDPAVGPAGANVNFVSQPDGSGPWDIRTFERGVEGETLACGTGAVAAAVILEAWGFAGPETRLRTRSGSELGVRLHRSGDSVTPALRGEGRLVFGGRFADIRVGTGGASSTA